MHNARYGVHFPQDPPLVYRFPYQLLETAELAIISAILLFVEKKRGTKPKEAILFPLFLLLYGLCRYISSPLREKPAFLSASAISLSAIAAAAVWLINSLTKNRRKT